MTQEKANELVSKLTANIDVIKSVIKSNLGLLMDFEPVIYGKYDKYVNLNEIGNASTEHLTHSPLLAQMFKKAQIQIRCFMEDDGISACLSVHISYDHSYRGGSNGRELMIFNMDLAEGEVLYIDK